MAITALIGYGLLIIFFAIEGRLRRGTEARSFEEGQFDQRSTQLLGRANEKRMLLSTLPGYAEYCSNIWRLIPPIY